MSSSTSNGPSDYVEFRPEQLHLATGTPVGAGAISQVLQSRLTSPPISIVVKILSKIQLLQQKKVASAMNEKAALIKLGPHPYIARLYGTGQSTDELYFVMECLPHGDLLQHIRRSASARIQAYSAAVKAGIDPEVALLSSPSSSSSSSSPSAQHAVTPAAVAETIDMDTKTATADEAPVVPIPATSKVLRCLDFNDIQLITAQLVLALAHTSEKGVVLRDLKPENVVFDSKYRACLIDFDTVDLDGAASQPESNHGVALKPREGNGDDKHKTTDGTSGGSPPSASAAAAAAKRLSVSDIQRMRKKTENFCGTAQYVSPEMVGECKWSFSSDLWALGATVYEMVYGVHMFSGLGPFEVMQKVVKGVTTVTDGSSPVPFPEVNLSRSNGGEEKNGAVKNTPSNTGNNSSSFARVKDFILRLMNLDPRGRVGAHPTTGAFDLAALKAHPLFDGFDWTVVESHLTTFRPRVFPRQSTGPSAPSSSTQSNAAAAAAAAADSDPSPSLQAYYHRPPFNDATYANYVYKATADANPFERYMKHILLQDEHDGEQKADEADGQQTAKTTTTTKKGVPGNPDVMCDSTTPTPTDSTPSSAPPLRFVGNNGSDEDDMMDVIDDVGMHYTGIDADEDFRK